MANDELLRIYTPEGLPTDKFKPRSEVHRDGDWHGTVHLWLMNSSDQLLFQKRSDNAELHPGLWDVSAAGHMVNDDSPEISLQREAAEELGLVLAAREAKFLFRLKTEWHYENVHECVYQYIYLSIRDIDTGALQLQADEVARVKWHHYSLLAGLLEDANGFVPRMEEYAGLLNYLENSDIA